MAALSTYDSTAATAMIVERDGSVEIECFSKMFFGVLWKKLVLRYLQNLKKCGNSNISGIYAENV
jgi:hypothetical protein